MTERWVGIDEAGYGPNLGPLVLTAVAAEGARPDLWNDRPGTIRRAGQAGGMLAIDDSKRLYSSTGGFEALEAATLAALVSTGRALPTTLGGLLGALSAGSLAEVELDRWLPPGADPPLDGARHAAVLSARPLEGERWRLVELRAVVVGPARFNRVLGAVGSKARVHFLAFAELLRWLWTDRAAPAATHVVSDKHGGRHFYFDLLMEVFPGTWIERGAEGPAASRYTLRDGLRRLDLCLRPRADAEDGLVALASLASKLLREHWMAVFNAYWLARVPGLRPTAGYALDAARFRAAIEPTCAIDPALWWRAK
jgi:hypothetical protein